MVTDWNALAKGYSVWRSPVDDWDLCYGKVLGRLGQKELVLDFGCGAGKFSKILADLGMVVMAMDPSEEMIRLAEPHSRIIYWDSNLLASLNSNSFDGAVSTFVLCTIHDDFYLERSFKQIHDKLKVGSPFVILDPHPSALGTDYLPGERKIRWGRSLETTLDGMEGKLHDCLRPVSDYIELFQFTGFDVTHVDEQAYQGKNQYLLVTGVKR